MSELTVAPAIEWTGGKLDFEKWVRNVSTDEGFFVRKSYQTV